MMGDQGTEWTGDRHEELKRAEKLLEFGKKPCRREMGIEINRLGWWRKITNYLISF